MSLSSMKSESCSREAMDFLLENENIDLGFQGVVMAHFPFLFSKFGFPPKSEYSFAIVD